MKKNSKKNPLFFVGLDTLPKNTTSIKFKYITHFKIVKEKKKEIERKNTCCCCCLLVFAIC